jgi:hypothetical protein
MFTQSCLENQQKQVFILTQASYLFSLKTATFERKKRRKLSITGKMSNAPLAPPDQYPVQVQVEQKILHLPC